MPLRYHTYPIGDTAITIEFGNSINTEVNKHCLSIASLILNKKLPGVKDVIPAYATVSLIYDPVQVSHSPHITSPYQYIRQKIDEVINAYQSLEEHEHRTIRVPVCVDESFAPDLSIIAEQKDRSETEVINIFLARQYRVYMIGFLPGFAYMGTVDDAIATPRKENPHLNIPAGSIGIAGNQTGIYPLNSPGGWNIIGRTPLQLFNKDLNYPCLLKAGDEIQFYRISMNEFNELNKNL